ncbi:MAG: aminopeptidase P family protein [bacterium]
MNNNKITALQKNIKEVDLFLITGINNIFYLTGFTGSSAVLLVTKKDAVFFTDFRYKEQSAREVKLDCREASSAKIVIVKNSLWTEIISHSIFKGVKKIGFEYSIDYSAYEYLKTKLKGKKLIPLRNKIEDFRTIKNDYEIATITKAVEIADTVFASITRLIKPGISEEEIAVEFEYQIRKNGGSGISFPTIVASGLNAALPHAIAGSRKIKNGDTVVFDCGAIYKKYCSDMTRTLIIGKNPLAEKVYKIVLNAQETAIKAIKPGVSLKKIDTIARNIITKAGYGKYFGHSLGHGIGLDVHESPKSSPKSEDYAKPGMVFSVEPGIYLPGKLGVRIEDLVLVTDKGVKILTKSNKCAHL